MTQTELVPAPDSIEQSPARDLDHEIDADNHNSVPDDEMM